MSTTMQHNGQQTVPMGPPPSPSPPPSKSRRIAIIAAVSGLALAVLAIATVFIINQNHTTTPTPPSQTYQAKLSATLTPIVNENISLSKALQAVDGGKSSLHGAKDAVSALQQQTTSARGALSALPYPASMTLTQQQATQTLTQEAGYVQAVTSTLADPNSNASGSLQSLASATNSAFVPLNSYAAGGSTSIYGVDNLLSWVSGAQAAGRNKPPTVINNNTTVTSNGGGVPDNGGVQSAPDGGSTPGLYSVDSNISATTGISAGLASNVFYDYWPNGGGSYSSWSPSTGQYYSVSASSDGSTVTAYVYGTSISGQPYVTFSQKAINDYTRADAARFLASGNHG